ncbi:MAG: hypothetical protein V4616_00480 [Bacteroidota bacterium]
MSGFKSLDTIVEQINHYINQLNSGKLAVTDIDSLLQEVQQLQERLIILRYKAFESTATVDPEPVAEIPAAPVSPPEPEKPAAIETPISFSINPTPVSVTPENPSKQVSLMDVINQALQNTPEATSDLSAVLRQASTSVSSPASITVVNSGQVAEKKPVTEEPAINPLPDLRKPAAPKSDADEVPLAQRLQKSAIGDLGKAIPLHQKFVFINELFHQNSDDYHSSIEQLNKFDEMEEAMSFLKSHLMPLYKWNREDKNVELFIDLVERRFL